MLDGENYEGKVLLPHRKAVLWSGGDARKPLCCLWKGAVMSLFPLTAQGATVTNL